MIVPKGFAHGFVVRSDIARFVYKCDDFYYSDDEYGVLWDDPQLAIDWGNVRPELTPRRKLLTSRLDKLCAAAALSHLWRLEA